MIALALAGWGAMSAMGNKWVASGGTGVGGFIELGLGCGSQGPGGPAPAMGGRMEK